MELFKQYELSDIPTFLPTAISGIGLLVNGPRVIGNAARIAKNDRKRNERHNDSSSALYEIEKKRIAGKLYKEISKGFLMIGLAVVVGVLYIQFSYIMLILDLILMLIKGGFEAYYRSPPRPTPLQAPELDWADVPPQSESDEQPPTPNAAREDRKRWSAILFGRNYSPLSPRSVTNSAAFARPFPA